MLRLVLELPRLLLELPYELLEEEELPPRCCDWPNNVWPEIASKTESRHVPVNVNLRMVQSCSISPAMPGVGVVPAWQVGYPHTLPRADLAGLNASYWKTDLQLPPHLGVTCAGCVVDG